MGKALQRLSMLVGLTLYVFDYGSDIYVAYQYWQNGHIWWFGLTVGFIVGPSIIVNITAIIQVTNYLLCLAAVFQLSIIFRYFETIWKPESSRIYSLAKLRYLETITESAPQWCLQGYIMLRQWKFPKYTMVSMSFSLLSLAYSITCLEKARRDKRKENFNTGFGYWFLVWQLSTHISRLFGIALFGFVFRYYIFILLGAHWILQAAVVLIIERSVSTEKFWKSLLRSLLSSPSTVFHASESVVPTDSGRKAMLIGYIIIVIETVTMVIVSLMFGKSSAHHMRELRPIAIGLITGGLTCSIICAIILYRCEKGCKDQNAVHLMQGVSLTNLVVQLVNKFLQAF